MNDKTPVEIAQLFSEGKFTGIENYLSADIVWNVYEEKRIISGKQAVLEFMRRVGGYFKTITTKFETFGILEDKDKVAIYGKAEFILGSRTINTIYSCDVYIFDGRGYIQKIHSYCNSNKAN